MVGGVSTTIEVDKMKSIVSASIDTHVLQQFKLEHTNKKLSTVLNELLKTYVNTTPVNTQECDLQNERAKIQTEINKLQAKQININLELQKLEDKNKQANAIKERFWVEVIQKKLPDCSRERYESKYETLWKQEAMKRYGGNK